MFVRYFFATLMLMGLGILFSRGVYGSYIFEKLAIGVGNFLDIADQGSEFLFGTLAIEEYFYPDSSYWPGFGFQFAFSVLPTIIFFSAIMSILYYMGVMQVIVQMMARFMRWTMGTSGAETLSCSANIFIGQTEAPLLIKPFLDDMTLSELHAVMVGGFATIAGGVLAGYISMGVDAGHLIAASVMAAPAALVIAKIMLPETEQSKTAGDIDLPDVGHADNLLDAAARGTTDGLKLAVNVGAMLLAFIALIGVVNMVLGYFDKLIDFQLLGGQLKEGSTEYKGFFPGSLNTFFGTIFSPIALLMGVPWKEAMDVGNLLGMKIAINEFVAYAELGKYIAAGDLSPRAITIATYALCGFANFSSIGIQIGGIGAIAPKRRSELSRVALRAMFAGAIVSWISATIAGMLI
ncbi:NupC/NupG family nucleoside CNT transporter [candidate division KSB1 bacterium]|nr:NupC/NupG family nucleoside CNT transporter [candidate division KSB1 bacterium]RQW00238.1 MAG: NupC/NupG family nucleoside CNT transporter [candidate division KSB1 bacterium]